ncbi:N-acetyl-gamma-glutamyl-phosphate reductase [gamma proteobacterium HIMB55]|nr:N-acetyl-gamma-glutamyl-phosphate reductase [gamma proteobacterium HIMB55]
MIKVGIVGATGYAGVELIRLLLAHPEVEITRLTSRAEAGVRVDRLFPNLRGAIDSAFEDPADSDFDDCDVVFFATPHAVAMNTVPALIEKGKKVIDLSADFRLENIQQWESWYGVEHVAPDLVKQAVYGLPELNREALRSAQLVACPGCYPTAVQLGFMPLLQSGVIDQSSLIASCASGTSGAGRSAKINLLLTEATESMKSYGVSGHRHLPEMEQGLSRMAGSEVKLTFVPHLAPMVRGIHATLFAKLTNTSADLRGIFQDCYCDEPFVVLTDGDYEPETRHVAGTNRCEIDVTRPEGDTVVVTVAIDNLVKGASGQAIQAMNLMHGFDETLGLESPAVIP